jgi:hypothetical protein
MDRIGNLDGSVAGDWEGDAVLDGREGGGNTSAECEEGEERCNEGREEPGGEAATHVRSPVFQAV